MIGKGASRLWETTWPHGIKKDVAYAAYNQPLTKVENRMEAYLAEPAAMQMSVMQMSVHPSEAVVAERLRQYLADRLAEPMKALGADCYRLAKVLVEIFEIATGEVEIAGWRYAAN